MSVATMTIVVFFEDATIGGLARDRIHTLIAKHPSRVVVFDGTRAEAAHELEPADWIELGVRGRNAQELSADLSVVRLADMPVILLWIATGIGDDERFCELAPQAQTIVYNSSLVDAGHGALCQLVEYAQAHPALPLADIAYLRLAPWQESVAILFDGDEAPELTDLAQVEIGCGTEPEAYYLLGWLASRLGWTPQSAGTFRDAAGKLVEFALRRVGEPRRIARIALTSRHSRFTAEASGDAIHLDVTGRHRKPSRYRAINNPGIAALLERAILTSQNDRIFRASLTAAGEILGCA